MTSHSHIHLYCGSIKTNNKTTKKTKRDKYINIYITIVGKKQYTYDIGMNATSVCVIYLQWCAFSRQGSKTHDITEVDGD